MRIHELKIWPTFFDPVREGKKTAELRKADRDFQEGDLLNLREWNPTSETYTGRSTHCTILHVARGQPIPAGYVLLSIARANYRPATEA